MKKIFAIILVLVLTLSLLTACGGTIVDDVSKDDSDDGTFAYGNGTDYIANHLTGDYSITYKLSTSVSQEDAMEVICTRTSQGYYYKYAGIEALYIKNEDGYDIYYGGSEGTFAKVDFMEPIPKEDVEKQMAAIIGFMAQYSGSNISDMKKSGNETVAGRDCVKYVANIASPLGALQWIYCIDKETGVCLKYTWDMAAMGESGGFAFECSEFKTSGVVLPEYN